MNNGAIDHPVANKIAKISNATVHPLSHDPIVSPVNVAAPQYTAIMMATQT